MRSMPWAMASWLAGFDAFVDGGTAEEVRGGSGWPGWWRFTTLKWFDLPVAEHVLVGRVVAGLLGFRAVRISISRSDRSGRRSCRRNACPA